MGDKDYKDKEANKVLQNCFWIVWGARRHYEVDGAYKRQMADCPLGLVSRYLPVRTENLFDRGIAVEVLGSGVTINSLVDHLGWEEELVVRSKNNKILLKGKRNMREGSNILGGYLTIDNNTCQVEKYIPGNWTKNIEKHICPLRERNYSRKYFVGLLKK